MISYWGMPFVVFARSFQVNELVVAYFGVLT